MIDAVTLARRLGGDRHRPEIFEAIDLLGATEGILTEPAGGTTIAATMKLAAEGKIGPDDTVVAVISGNGYKTLDEHPEKPWPGNGRLRRRVDGARPSPTSGERAPAQQSVERRAGAGKDGSRRGPGRRAVARRLRRGRGTATPTGSRPKQRSKPRSARLG